MPKMRTGKTEREHKSGVHGNRFDNRDLRVAHQHSRSSSGQCSTPFPRHACNGKKNRYHVTGKGGKRVEV